MYNPEDYSVIETHYDSHFGILKSAKINVKGAIFFIRRVYANNHTFHGKPTHIFEFDDLNSFVDGNSSNELIEIGWNNAPAGLVKIGKELGLDYKMGSSLFSNGNSKPHFVEVKV